MVKRNETARRIAKGAAGLAITAGVVAVGAALMDEEVRGVLTSRARRGMDTVKDALSEQMDSRVERYRSIAHEIRPNRRKVRGRKMGSVKKAGRK